LRALICDQAERELRARRKSSTCPVRIWWSMWS
jgi:hypothetical protein